LSDLTSDFCKLDGLHETAWAKVNLSLTVLGRRLDGYHELSSVVGFCDQGDQLILSPGPGFDLRVGGMFASSIDGENLISRVARALVSDFGIDDIGVLHLEKNLPVGAGIGGGSADAAAFLRLMERRFDLAFSGDEQMCFGKRFGADVPVCLRSKPAFMSGIGDLVHPLEEFPSMGILLVNPGVNISTSSIFQGLDCSQIEADFKRKGMPLVPSEGFDCVSGVVNMLREHPNDLLGPCLKEAPIVGHVLEVIDDVPECQIARLSGSGATCFGLFQSFEEARVGAQILKEQHKDWWVCASTLKSVSQAR